MDIGQALGVESGRCIAFVGGGGKTTTMLALAAQAERRHLKCLVTTTTRMWQVATIPLLLADDSVDLVSQLVERFSCSRQIQVGERLSNEGKVLGIQPETVCLLARSGVADILLCEADGSAGRPLKVHGPGEPVLPACAEVVVVAGMQSIGRPISPETVHRFEYLSEVAPATEYSMIDPAFVAKVLKRASRIIGPDRASTYLLNCLDDDQALDHAADTACYLRDLPAGSRIFAALRGTLVPLDARGASLLQPARPSHVP